MVVNKGSRRAFLSMQIYLRSLAEVGINMKWEQSWGSGQCALRSLHPLALKVQALRENSQDFVNPHHSMVSKANMVGPAPGSAGTQGTSAVTTKQLAPTAWRMASFSLLEFYLEKGQVFQCSTPLSRGGHLILLPGTNCIWEDLGMFSCGPVFKECDCLTMGQCEQREYCFPFQKLKGVCEVSLLPQASRNQKFQ